MAISDELRKLVDPSNECCCEHCIGNKCKEWALSQGYYFELNICLSVIHLKLWKDVGITKLFKSFKGSKEIEVYYKACQWILENKN